MNGKKFHVREVTGPFMKRLTNNVNSAVQKSTQILLQFVKSSTTPSTLTETGSNQAVLLPCLLKHKTFGWPKVEPIDDILYGKTNLE